MCVENHLLADDEVVFFAGVSNEDISGKNTNEKENNDEDEDADENTDISNFSLTNKEALQFIKCLRTFFFSSL